MFDCPRVRDEVQDGQVRRSRSVEGVPVGDQRHQVLGPSQVRGSDVIAARGQARQSHSSSARAIGSTASRSTASASGSTGNARQVIEGEGKGHTPSDRPRQVVSRRAGTAVPSEWKVVFGYAYAIPAGSASRAGHADNGSRSYGRLMVMKPEPLGPRRYTRRGPS